MVRGRPHGRVHTTMMTFGVRGGIYARSVRVRDLLSCACLGEWWQCSIAVRFSAVL